MARKPGELSIAGTGRSRELAGLAGTAFTEETLQIIFSRMSHRILQTTERARKNLDITKSTIIKNSKVVKGNVQDIQAELETEGDKILDVIHKGVFIALDETSSEGAGTAQKKLFKAIKDATGYVGLKNTEPLKNFVKKINAEYRELFYLDEDSEDGKFVLFFDEDNEPRSKADAEKAAFYYVKDAFMDWDGTSDLFGISPSNLGRQYDPTKSDPNGMANPRDSVGRGTVHVVFKWAKGFKEHYHYVRVNFNIRVGPILEDPDIKVKKVDVADISYDDINIESRVVAELKPNVIPKSILDLEREVVRQGVSVFDYGHIVSAGTEKLAQILDVLLKFASTVDTKTVSQQPWSIFQNMITTITSLYNMSSKVDSLLEDWNSISGVETEDLLTILLTHNIDINKMYFIEKTNEGLKISSEVSRTITVEAGGELEIVAAVERADFNQRQKGVLTKKLLNILRAEFKAGFEQALTEDDILRLLQVKKSDSVIGAALKYIVGQKKQINRGKPTRVIKKRKGKINLNKASRGLPKIPLAPLGKVSDANNTRKRVPPKPKSSPVKISSTDIDLVSILNAEIAQEVKARMTSPALQYRSGRFARSVDIQGMDSNTIMYRYLYSPYQVFSRTKGKAPWNTVDRDPSELIQAAIRAIVQKYYPPLSNKLTFREV